MSDRHIYIDGEVFNGKVRTRLERQYTKSYVWMAPVNSSLTDTDKQSLRYIAERANIVDVELFLSQSENEIHTEKALLQSDNQTFNEDNNLRNRTKSVIGTIEKLCNLLTDDTTHSPSIINQMLSIASHNLEYTNGPVPDLSKMLDHLSTLRTAHQLALSDMTTSMESRHTKENCIKRLAALYSDHGGKVGSGSITNIFNDYVMICLKLAGHEKQSTETIRSQIKKYLS